MWQEIFTLLWGLVVLGSFVSLGRLVARALDSPLLGDVPLTAGLGMAAMVFVGGVLNLAHVATSGVLVVLVIALIAVEGLVSFRSRRSPGPGVSAAGEATGNGRNLASVAAIGMLLMLMALRYFVNLGYRLHPYDDLPFYLAEIAKLCQTGTLGVEPYHYRQMSTLLGQTFLSAMGCCVVSLKYAFLFDPGICWIVFGGLVYTFLRSDLRLSIPLAGLLATMSLLVRVVHYSNLGGNLSGPVLFLTAVRLMYTRLSDSAAVPFGRLVLVALVLSSLAVLKSTFLVYTCLFLALWTLLTLWRSGVIVAVREALPLAMFISLFMLPWMIQHYLSSGTLLYPILGKGYLFANHGFPLELHGDGMRHRLKNLIVYATHGYTVAPILTSIAAGLVFVRSPGTRTQALLAASMSALIGSYMICWVLATDVERYTVQMLYVSCLLPGLVGLTMAARGELLGLVLGCAFIMFLGNQWQDNPHQFIDFLRRKARGEDMPEPAYAAKIQKVQSLTEPGKRILASVTSPFLFDFRRNPIWDFDFIGMLSPPPGLPLTRDWKKLESVLDGRWSELPPPGPVSDFRDSLVRSGVDYLLFERDPRVVQWPFPFLPTSHFLDRMLVAVSQLSKESLVNLIRDRHVVCDDGNMILLDLRQPHLPADPPITRLGAEEHPAGD